MTILTFVDNEFHHMLAALIAGARYGIKVRLPHAFVMTFLFRQDLNAKQKLRAMLKLAGEHATNLAAFACIYKSILMTMKVLSRQIRNGGLQSTGNNREGLWKSMGRSVAGMLRTFGVAMTYCTV
jgi:hypothetical protein